MIQHDVACIKVQSSCSTSSPGGNLVDGLPPAANNAPGDKAAAFGANMARRTCFREQYYTGTRRYYSAREDSRPRPKKTIYEHLMVFHSDLWINVFVWVRAVCGTRYCCSASARRSGAIQKIHMRKIRRDQGSRT